MIQIPKPVVAGSGVYMIRCLVDKRAYIGSSKDIKRRLQNHKSALRKNRHHSAHLQRAWNKHGEGLFEFVVLGYYPEDRLREEEQFWLDEATCAFNGTRNAYRPDHDADQRAKISAMCKSVWATPEHRAKMSLRQWVPTRAGAKASPELVAKLQEVHRAKHRTVQAFGKLWSIKELAEAYGMKYTMLKDRLRAGWEPEKAVLQPKRSGGL